ncbi:MAG: hypothetical protein K8R21_09840 [Leptospira sp.]|nr:hypothetical protein [Leptospira sp.]
MGFNINPVSRPANAISISDANFFKEISLSGEVNAKVLSNLKDLNYFMISIQGKTWKVKSNSILFPGEELLLRILRNDGQFSLEIQNRSFREARNVAEQAVTKPLTKNFSNSPLDLVEKFSLGQTTKKEENLFSVLQTYFPELEWVKDTPFFYWQFPDSDASGYYGRGKDRKVFYLIVQSKALSKMSFSLAWSLEDLSDLTIQSVFESQNTYSLALENRSTLLEILQKNGIYAKELCITFVPESETRGHAVWIG